MLPSTSPIASAMNSRTNSGHSTVRPGLPGLNGSSVKGTAPRLATASAISTIATGTSTTTVTTRLILSAPPEGPRAARLLGAVQPLAQFLARLEERNPLFVDVNRLAAARIAPDPLRPVLDRERAEPA